ncbi:MAG: bifunctional phosphoribosyl-AMP cyclohydrolase/phosphoribosyl-ATP diphosphatase HisIE [Oscillospiraceae bacterium]|nr:bifunctional phosphoribosyl-AMP cyclohydrolase/phosphoribosyl-ATP diphosphatase HisIE [Oscillospiraceae bacterium]
MDFGCVHNNLGYRLPCKKLETDGNEIDGGNTMEEIINTLKFDASGLIPAVVQNIETGEVLMVAYMNADTIRKTVETGRATFWSRSRREVWVKGETSGNYMYVKEIRVDCDCDCLVLLVNPAGNACHTGNRSCFFRKIEDGKLVEDKNEKIKSDVFAREQAVVIDRKENPEDGSYTNYLFDKGEDKILKKVGEEAAEVVIAGKNRDKDEISYEVADLIYHLTVMLVDNGMTWEDIYAEMERRRN